VSGAELAAAMGVSRTAVWKHIRALERKGYGIEAVPSKGYRLTSQPDVIVVSDLLEKGPVRRVVGSDIRYYPETASTNTLAMDLAQKGASHGTVVLAETQTGGKGRLGRVWASPLGNVYLSAVLRPNVPANKAPLITLMGAVAVASAIRSYPGLDAGIKWPNDVLLSGKKVAGLLTEMSAEQDRVRYVVLGIGVNVNMGLRELPADVRPLATTLSIASGRTVDRTELLRQLLGQLDRWYAVFVKDEAGVLVAWKSLNITLGQRVAVSSGGATMEGLAEDVDHEGRLLVKLADGTVHRVAAGDVTILKRNN
jgi:BirA family biotin operon repressor/biotin-[acetyl-CoA-carboxylase] ligase